MAFGGRGGNGGLKTGLGGPGAGLAWWVLWLAKHPHKTTTTAARMGSLVIGLMPFWQSRASQIERHSKLPNLQSA